MDSYSLQAFQNEIICSICMNSFIDLVTIDCGHNFCRSCLCLWCEEGRAPVRCPECRKISAKLDFNTNVALKKLASLARQTRPQNINNLHNICVLLEETKELFCEVDKQLLCGPCSESPEHMAHSHSPIGWAAEECREKLIKEMDYLWKINQETQNNLNQETRKFRSLVKTNEMTGTTENNPRDLFNETKQNLNQRDKVLLKDEEGHGIEGVERVPEGVPEAWGCCGGWCGVGSASPRRQRPPSNPEWLARKDSTKDSGHLRIPKWPYKVAKEEKREAEEA
ncbi:hypothetical protein H8959_002997 [Pygathrix nigripes]